MSAAHDQAFEDAMRLEIALRPHVTTKNVFGKMIEKSFGQDFVDMKGDDGRWRHIGYYSHGAKSFCGLVNFDNSLNEQAAAEIAKMKGHPVSYAGAPQNRPELTEEDEDDELD